MESIKYIPAGDSALVVSFGEDVDEAVNRRVLSSARQLRGATLGESWR